jgi:hypothetical protein
MGYVKIVLQSEAVKRREKYRAAQMSGEGLGSAMLQNSPEFSHGAGRGFCEY